MSNALTGSVKITIHQQANLAGPDLHSRLTGQVLVSGGAAAHPHTSELGLQAADLAGDRTHPAHTHTHTSGGRCDHSRTQAADQLQVSNQPQANLFNTSMTKQKILMNTISACTADARLPCVHTQCASTLITAASLSLT
jgi:hypothetical protein